jgi:hypothetical protein
MIKTKKKENQKSLFFKSGDIWDCEHPLYILAIK